MRNDICANIKAFFKWLINVKIYAPAKSEISHSFGRVIDTVGREDNFSIISVVLPLPRSSGALLHTQYNTP